MKNFFAKVARFFKSVESWSVKKFVKVFGPAAFVILWLVTNLSVAIRIIGGGMVIVGIAFMAKDGDFKKIWMWVLGKFSKVSKPKKDEEDFE